MSSAPNNHTDIPPKRSKANKTNSGINYLNKFLVKYPTHKAVEKDDSGNFVFTDRDATKFDELDKSVFDTKCEFLGTFSGFLYDECDGVTAWNTHKAYVSAVKCHIEYKFPDIYHHKNKHYERLLSNIRCLYELKSCSTGIPIVENAKLIDIENHYY